MNDKKISSSLTKARVLSGVQPTGEVHLGNYLGAFKGWINNQQQKENYFCIVDLHAITVFQDPNDLRSQIRSLSAILISAGLDTTKSTLFIQSHVRAHCEANWILSCVTPLGWLERMTQYKDKSSENESVMMGLLAYPVLMAGDILLYSADEVPVGEDQKQHVELTRDIAQRFNNIYGETFVIPQPVIPKVAARVMGLNSPNIKMSKSHAETRGHSVKLLDEPKEIERSFMRAVTDSDNEIMFSSDPKKAGVNNLLSIYQVITEKTKAQVERDFSDARGYGDLKKRVAEVVIDELSPIRERYHQLMTNPDELDKILALGSEKAATIAEPKINEMKYNIGFIPGKFNEKNNVLS